MVIEATRLDVAKATVVGGAPVGGLEAVTMDGLPVCVKVRVCVGRCLPRPRSRATQVSRVSGVHVVMYSAH